MSFAVNITGNAQATIEQLAEALQSKDYAPAVGEAGKRVLMDHFAKKERDATSHRTAARLGARPSGLYADFARSTSWKATPAGVLVSVSHVAARQRLEGGTIKPVNSTYLTIPAHSSTYGRRARETGVAYGVLWGKDKSGGVRPVALVEGEQTTGRDGRSRTRPKLGPDGRATTVYYWLAKEITQKPDPTVIPPDAEFVEGIRAALQVWIDEVMQ